MNIFPPRQRFWQRLLATATLLLSVGTCHGVSCHSVSAQQGQSRLLVGSIGDRTVEGVELIGASNRQVILGNDGWLFDFDPRRQETRLTIAEGDFQPLDAHEFRRRLYEEFGNRFEVVPTQHFLLVQPNGSGRVWAERFERLHRTFLSYFSVRGVRLLEGNFPMVAVIYPSQAEFQQRATGSTASNREVLGVYDRASNRITMYDHGQSAGGVDATICHEAAHQSAFNVGVHSRLADTPHWIVEGIGCIFQSPAMIEGRRSGDLQGRCDPNLLWLFRDRYQQEPALLAADLDSLIADNTMFRSSDQVQHAYVASWALTFYLAERRAADFAKLIDRYSQRPPFQVYRPADRQADLQQIVSTDLELLARQITRFLDQF